MSRIEPLVTVPRQPSALCTIDAMLAALDGLMKQEAGNRRAGREVAEGFQMLAGSIAPSHAYVHVVEFGVSVTIYSMEVKSGDLIHADRHGCRLSVSAAL